MRSVGFFVCFFTFFIFVGGALQPGVSGFVAPAQAAGHEAEGETPEFEYFEMNPLMIPVVTHRGISQQVSFVISIEVPYGKMNEISLYQPRLADAYIQDLYGVLGAGYGLVNGNVLDVQAIKKRLGFVTDKVIGDRFETDVLLQVVQQRPL